MKNLIEKFDALTDCKRITFVIIPMAVALIWLLPWALEKNYRIMKYFGEQVERCERTATVD